MALDRRFVVALFAIALVLAPAAVLRALCVGHSCDDPAENRASTPFCALPEGQRRSVVAGFREGRSPDVLVVPHEPPDNRVPLLFAGTGIDAGASIPEGTRLDAVAPTLAEAIGLDRPHPEVRSGKPVDGLTTGERPKLIVLIAVVGLGSDQVSDARWDALENMEDAGAASLDVVVGSTPHDRAAITTTIGTGGLPDQHGITGTFVRNEGGRVVPSWGRGAPVSVIASVADDMDELQHQEPRIGLIAASPRDRGLIGGNWYVGNDEDDITIQRSPTKAAAASKALLADDYGTDEVTDLFAVSLEGPPPEVDGAIEEIVTTARAVSSEQVVVVVAGTGAVGEEDPAIAGEVERILPGPTTFIERAVSGGFFVDQDALARTGADTDAIVDAVVQTGAFADAFPAITVEFARYC